MRTLLLVCVVTCVLALGALEVVASRLASEQMPARMSGPPPTWLAR
jgi:hypothetical protein